MGLGQRIVQRFFGEAIQAEALKIVKQSAASGGPDPDEQQWRRTITQQSRRDLSPLDQDRLIEIANYLTSRNGLGSRASQVRRDFVIGSGVRYEAEAKEIQEILDRFWNDPINGMDEFQFQIVEYLGINGELFLPVFVNGVNGAVQLGWIDPFEVEQVIADKMNRRIMREVTIKPGVRSGSNDTKELINKRVYQIVNIALNLDDPAFGFRQGEILHFRINCAPDAVRGRSDFESVADLLDSWDQAVFNDLERSQLAKNFVWDVLLKGMTPEQIQKWSEGQKAPAPGSIRAHNENVEWATVTPELKITESRALTDGVRRESLGAMGLSDSFFGFTEANRASAEALDLPLLKGFESRQRKVRAVFQEIGDVNIDAAALADPKLKAAIVSGEISRGFKTVMPELSAKDMTKVGAIISSAAASLDLAVERAWLTKGTAGKIFAGLMQAATGVEYDPVEEMKKAAKEQSDAATNTDYTPEKLKGLRDAAAA